MNPIPFAGQLVILGLAVVCVLVLGFFALYSVTMEESES